MNSVDWLPALILLQDYGGNWNKYVEALYRFYSEDFIESKPIFEGKKIRLKKLDKIRGKDATSTLSRSSSG